MTDEWRANGKELFFSDDPHDFVGFHTEALAPVIVERHNATVAERDQYRHMNSQAAQLFVQTKAERDEALALTAELESQLGQAHAEISRLEAALLQAALMKTIKGARRIVADTLRKATT